MFPIIPANGANQYQIPNSLRLRSSASAYLSRTPASAGNRTMWTWSGWVKRGVLGATQVIFEATDAAGSTVRATNRFTSADTLGFSDSSSGLAATTTQVFRDPSAWYHFVVAIDTMQATASNRFKLYVNGVQVTSFSSITYPTQNANTLFNSTSYFNYLGATRPAFSQYFDGYLADVNFIDGQALTPSSFGEINSTTGVWTAKRYTGTYGTNGFRLNFSNGTSTTTLGYDSSGNGNNWTTNNISLTAGSTYDWMIDSPTKFPGSSYGVGNYAVMNPLDAYGTTSSDGNLTTVVSTSTRVNRSSFAIKTGKWYWEITCGPQTIPAAMIGVSKADVDISSASYTGPNGWFYYGNSGAIWTNNSPTTFGATYATNDVIGLALDCDSGTLIFYKNGVSQGTGVSSGITNTLLSPSVSYGSSTGSNTFYANFGQRPFAYTPPSGYKSLCTQNLPGVTIQNGAQYMAATTYTGTGSSVSISNAINGVSFQPDFVWIKDRSVSSAHALTNSVVGTTKYLESNTTLAETTDTTSVTALNTNGFSLGAGTATYYTNRSGESFVAWQWKAGGTAVSNTAGTITSSVSANTTSGFSVVTYTGTGANATVGHGLGIAPSMIIIKERSPGGDNWQVYHSSVISLANGKQWLALNTTDSVQTNGSATTFTSASATTFGIGDSGALNQSTATYVAYCFAAIPGYSAFGSYTGNGVADGPFVYCGFRPRWILAKPISAVGEWRLFDTARSPYNAAQGELFPDLSNAEIVNAGYNTDILSNGFKPRASSTGTNDSGVAYIYAAFAENPFQNALAR